MQEFGKTFGLDSKDKAWVGWQYDDTCPCAGNKANWAKASDSYTCAEGRVTKLHFKYSHLGKGMLPEALTQLTALQELSLQDEWEVTGTLPDFITELRNLTKLAIFGTKISGSFPEAYSAMTQLQELELKGLDLSSLPASFSNLKRLKTLKLAYCNLKGIPAAIVDLPALKKLNLQGDQIGSDGSLPLELTAMKALTDIAITDNKIIGSIPEAYSTMTRLTWLDLENVKGTLPEFLTTFTGLEGLTLVNFNISGRVPDWLSSMTHLKKLKFDRLDLSGPLPRWVTEFKNLSHLEFSRNKMTGVLPEEYSSLTGITYMCLNDNNFTGTIPSSWGTLTNIVGMYLSSNNLTGTLPDSWSAMKKAENMWLQNQPLSGPLPKAWSTMYSIREMMLYNTSVSGPLPEEWSGWNKDSVDSVLLHNNMLTGTLPKSWEKFYKLRQFSVANNMLEGAVPTEWSNWNNLKLLFLQNNKKLNGTLPESFSAMKEMQHMMLQNNQFTGTLPAAWQDMTKIVSMDLSGNRLEGPIPQNWTTMTDIGAMSLGRNNLSGPLPAAWSDFTKVSLLSLRSNKFDGSLPAQWSKMANLKKLDLSSNLLAGVLPAAWSSLSELQLLDLSDNLFEGTLPSQWSALGVSYLGVSNNAKLCDKLNECYSNLTVSGAWANLSHVSAQGGDYIPKEWCTSTQLPNNHTIQLLYVGDTPIFDKNMENICLSQNPERYQVRWLKTFNVDDASASLGISTSDMLLATQSLTRDLNVQLVDGAITQSLKRTLDQMKTLIEKAGDGWDIGDGGYYDPCVDRAGRRTAVIVFCIFAVLLLAILLDGWLQWTGRAGLVRIAVAFSDRIIASVQSVNKQEAKQPSKLRRVASKSMTAARMGIQIMGYLTPYTSTFVDIVTDLILVGKLYPHTMGYLVLAAFLATDIICATIMYTRMYQCQYEKPSAARRELNTQASGVDSGILQSLDSGRVKTSCAPIKQMFSASFNVQGIPGVALRALMALIFTPLLSVSMHITSFILAILVLIALAKGRSRYTWNFLGLDVIKCAKLRSFVVGFLEAPAAMAFTTFAYLAPHKRDVGTFIDYWAFMLGLATSILHVLLESWELKELLLAHNGNFSAVMAHVTNLQPELENSGGATGDTAGAVEDAVTVETLNESDVVPAVAGGALVKGDVEMGRSDVRQDDRA